MQHWSGSYNCSEITTTAMQNEVNYVLYKWSRLAFTHPKAITQSYLQSFSTVMFSFALYESTQVEAQPPTWWGVTVYYYFIMSYNLCKGSSGNVELWSGLNNFLFLFIIQYMLYKVSIMQRSQTWNLLSANYCMKPSLLAGR